MAITEDSAPLGFTTSDNPIVWQVSSTNTAQDNFEYVVNLKIDSQVNSKHFVFVERGTAAHFNANEIVKSEVPAPSITYNTIFSKLESFKKVDLQVLEKYGSPATEQNPINSSVTYAIKGRLDDLDWIDTDFTTADFYWWSDYPSTENYYVSYEQELFLFVRHNGSVDVITIELFDVNDTSIAIDTITLNNSEKFSRLNLKPSFIVSETTITQTNFDSAYYFKVSTSNVAVSEEKTFYMDGRCSLYPVKRLIFLSKLGALEAVNFNMLSRETTTGSDKRFNQEIGRWDDSDNWVYERSRGSIVSYSTSAQDKLLINSDWIKEDLQNWLVRNLLESPLVYLQDDDGIRQVVVSNRGYTKKTRLNDMLFNQEIELEYSNTRKSPII